MQQNNSQLEAQIELSYKHLALKETIWALLKATKEPSDLEGEGVESYFMFNIKAFSDENGIFIVYTNSSLYPSVSYDDLLIIAGEGIDKGVRQIAWREATTKLVHLRDKLYLDQARGAFKKVEKTREEIYRHIDYMRKIKTKETVFLI